MKNPDERIEMLDAGDHRIPCYRSQGAAPIAVYVHGFRSHGQGTKASALKECAQAAGYGFVSFDQPGSGRSEADFCQFTISRALDDLHRVVDHLAPAPVVLLGSSLGGVLAVAAAPGIGERLAGLLLIAPAFGLMRHYFDHLPRERLDEWQRDGVLALRDEYDDTAYQLDYGFYRDAQQYRAPASSRFDCPVVIFHGENDELLPVADSLAFAARATSPEISVFVVPGADHRVNQALPLMCVQLGRLCRQADVPGASAGPGARGQSG